MKKVKRLRLIVGVGCFLAAVFVCGAVRAEEDVDWGPSPEVKAQAHEYNKKTIALWKELRKLLYRGAFYDEQFRECGFECKHPEAQAWLERWSAHCVNVPKHTDSEAYLFILPAGVDGSMVRAQELRDIVLRPIGPAGYLRRHQFELATIYFEHPDLYQEYSFKKMDWEARR